MRRLFQHSLVYFLARGASAALNFLGLILFTRLLSPKEFGQYAVFYAVSSVFSTLLYGWLKLSALRFWADEHSRCTLIASIAYSFKLILPLSASLSLITGLLVSGMSGGGYRDLLVWAAFGFWFVVTLGIYELVNEILRAEGKPMAVLRIALIKGLIYFSLGSLLAFAGNGAYSLVLGHLVGMSLGLLFIAGKVLRPYQKKANRSLPVFKIRSFLLNDIAPYGIPLSLALFGSSLVMYTDRVMLGYFKGGGAAGIYAAVADLVNGLVNLPMSAVALASFPLMTQAIFQKKSDELARLMRTNFSMLFEISTPVLTLIILFPEFIAGILGPRYATTAGTILPFISVAVFVNALRMYHYDRAFHFSKRTSQLAVIMLFSAAVNLLLNLFLIPFLGLRGAAFSSIIAYSISIFLSHTLGKKLFVLSSPAAVVLPSLASAVISGVLSSFALPAVEGFTNIIAFACLYAVMRGTVRLTMGY